MVKNVDKHLGEKDRKKDSDDDTERGVRTMLKEYDLGAEEREGSISPPELELISHIRPSLSPLRTMDISSVRYRPAPVLTQAELTSTYGHPRLELPREGKVNISVCTL